MKKLVIILTIAIILFATPKQPTEQPSTATEETAPNVAMEQAEKVPKTHTEQVEETTEGNCELIPIKSKAATKEKPTEQETPLKECTEETKGTEPEETVECVDKGDQALAEYKPQSGNQPNPFESAPPAEIVDHPVEDIVGEGEDRPGEGKHF